MKKLATLLGLTALLIAVGVFTVIKAHAFPANTVRWVFVPVQNSPCFQGGSVTEPGGQVLQYYNNSPLVPFGNGGNTLNVTNILDCCASYPTTVGFLQQQSYANGTWTTTTTPPTANPVQMPSGCISATWTFNVLYGGTAIAMGDGSPQCNTPCNPTAQ